MSPMSQSLQDLAALWTTPVASRMMLAATTMVSRSLWSAILRLLVRIA